MFIQLLDFLIQVAGSFWIGLFLFRFYCLLIKCNLNLIGGNISQFIFKLTDWAVLPLRKILPKSGNFDLPTFLCAYGIQCLILSFHFFLFKGHLPDLSLFILGFFELILTAISALTWLVIIYVVVNWISSKDEIRYLVEKLVFPLLNPIKKLIPPIGGLDLSAFFLLLVFQIANIFLINIKSLFI
jgi:YggT family protein